jgi:hypothetical protein
MRMKKSLLAFAFAAAIVAPAAAQQQPPTGLPFAFGPQPVFSGACAVSAASVLGGTWGGSFVVTSSCTGPSSFTMTFPYAMPNGWACNAWDNTTVTDAVTQKSYTPTTAVFSIVAAASDIVTFNCTGF